jgi:hypothetical protein
MLKSYQEIALYIEGSTLVKFPPVVLDPLSLSFEVSSKIF